MSGLFVNKVLGALLASGLGIIMINKFSNVVMHAEVPDPEKFAYSLAVEAPSTHEAVVEIAFPSPAWLGARDAAKGAKVFKKCKSCHTAVVGGKDGTGPALWNIVGKPMASTAGFSYSSGMTAMGGTWGYEELDKFLTKPKDYVSKTKMSFNGLKKETDRAALIEFLRLAADTPQQQLFAQTQETVALTEIPTDVTEEVLQDTATTLEDTSLEMAGDVVEDVIKDGVEETKPADGGH